MNELIEKAYHFLTHRRYCYRQVFKGEQAAVVLADLAKFCRANDTTFHPDPRVHGLLEGRREVWLRLVQHLRLSPDQLWAIYTKAETPDGD